MNDFIKILANELIEEHINGGLWEVDELISKISRNMYELKPEKDKVGLLTLILEANELKFQKHNLECTNKVNCQTEREHIKINYFLQQELEEIGVQTSDNFTWKEKENYNEKLDEILQTIINANQIVSDQVEELKSEIEELKHLYFLGKKNWKQQLAGKMNSMVVSGVISEATAKPIIQGVLKPSFDFITDRLLE